MTRLARSASLVTILIALAACATPAAVPPPTGSMWGFFTDAEPTLGPRALIYTSSMVACETERRRRLGASPTCLPVTVTPGTGYYALALPIQLSASLPDGGIGMVDRYLCEKLRTDLFRSHNAMGDCAPVEVKRGR